MAKGTNDAEAFLATLDHPQVEGFRLLRSIFLAADPRISDGIKWKAPSFYFNDWFATFNLRATDSVQVILHTGAKVKANATEGIPIEDRHGLLRWLAKDRALLTLSGLDEVAAKRVELTDLIEQWIGLM